MKKVIVLAIGSFILLSCNSKVEKSETAAQEEKVQVTDQHAENVESVELNDGAKWIVNEEMKPFVLKGATLVNVYLQDNQTENKVLANELKDQNNQLIKSCTMKGKSHDELHKWLAPHLELVKELEGETDALKANEIVLKLKNSYQQYHQYFN